MFQKANVLISEEIQANTWPIMKILGIFGQFPFVIIRNRSGLLLQWSPWFALYSYTFGGLIIGSASYKYLHDIFLTNADSLDFITSTDKVVGLTLLCGYAMMAICGIFVVPSKFLQLLEYFECINQVDSIIHTTFTRTQKYASIFLLLALFAYNLVVQTTANYLDFLFSGAELGFLKIFRRNCSVSALCHMTLCAEYVGRHVAYTLDKRLVQLNRVLCKHYTKMVRRTERSNQDSQAITELHKAYLKLMQAGETLNKLFGLNNLLAVLSVLFQLVVGPYFIILLLKGQRKGEIELTLRVLIFVLQIVRVLLITEPWYDCMSRIDTTSSYICKLLSLNVERHYRNVVDAFALSLCLRQTKFTAWGLFKMNRLLITSLIGTVTTYVAILLQTQSKDTH